jgi:uncharacterized membrane protein SpoIIM required for sporulation
MWTTLVRVNLVLLVAAAAAGWLAASLCGAGAPPHASAAARGALTSDAIHIFAVNLHVGLLLLAGVCTLGVFSVAQLLWHGYWLGYLLSALTRGAASGTMPLVLSYLPVEFLAFALIATVAEGAAWMIIRSLAFHDRLRARPAAALLGGAVALLAGAACIEAWVKPAIGVLQPARLP